MDASTRESFLQFLAQRGIEHETGELLGYASDASFITLGVPRIIVFPKDEEECVSLVEYAVQHGIELVPRGTGSSTAGASIAPPGAVLVDVERVGACDKRGHRRGLFVPSIVDSKGEEFDLSKASIDDELYVHVGAGVTSDEVNRHLTRYRWTVAVTPSSGYSTFGGNFATNARGDGTPAYGAFGDTVRRLRIVTTTKDGARVVEVINGDEIRRLAGHHGLCGIVTELDVRIAPILKEEDMLCAVLSCEMEDIERLGSIMGELMKKVASSCRYYAGEFFFIDEGIVRPDDPIRRDPVLGDYFKMNPVMRKMVLLYRGNKGEMAPLSSIVSQSPEVAYRDVTYTQFQRMMGVRKAATGKAVGRVNVPGCEDFIVEDPALFGKVLGRMFAIIAGAAGRPVGHHYPEGVEVHYRPQVPVSRESIKKAWELNLKLREAVLRPELRTEDRREHGLGLALFRDAPLERQDELRRLKQKYDPAGIFCKHLMSREVEGRLVAMDFRF